MKTQIHPIPPLSFFEAFKTSEGQIVTSFNDSNIGVSLTTSVHVMRKPDGTYEARAGFCVLGSPNMPEEAFERCGHNPFHPDFFDNYASGAGVTAEIAVEAMRKDLKSIGDALWADFP